MYKQIILLPRITVYFATCKALYFLFLCTYRLACQVHRLSVQLFLCLVSCYLYYPVMFKKYDERITDHNKNPITLNNKLFTSL